MSCGLYIYVYYVPVLLFQVFVILIRHLYVNLATTYMLPHLLILGGDGASENAMHSTIR